MGERTDWQLAWEYGIQYAWIKSESQNTSRTKQTSSSPQTSN